MCGAEEGSFGRDTLMRRVPLIVSGVLEAVQIEATRGRLGPDISVDLETLVARLETLRDFLPSNGVLSRLEVVTAGDTEEDAVRKHWDDYICLWETQCARQCGGGHGPGGCLDVPWLLTECFVYQRIRACLDATPSYRSWDPFASKKEEAWHSAREMALNLIESLPYLDPTLTDQRLDFTFFLRQCLWGNRSDLSLHAGDVQAATSQSRAQGGQEDLLVDDGDRVWSHLEGGVVRVDLVLDNAGIELFADLCLADWLLTSGTVQTVVIHAKPIPWFVSDVTLHDFEWLLQTMEVDADGRLVTLATRWRKHLVGKRWVVKADRFWCSPCPFWHMPTVAPELYAELTTSNLVVFKGDLNYRKLVFDARWPYHTSFSTAIGPFSPAPILALRTNKADTIAGLQKGQGEALGKTEKDWMVSGKFGVIQFVMAPDTV
jgi:hypothetical protein